VDVTRKATSHAPRIVAEAGASAEAAPAEEEQKTATSVASNSPARIFIPGSLFSTIIVMPRLINKVDTVTVASFSLRDPPYDAPAHWMRKS
jgi:hypothetical protein